MAPVTVINDSSDLLDLMAEILHELGHEMVGEDDLVAARWTATGTHTGKWGGVEPTDRRVTFSGVNLFRFRDGKVAEIWNHRDDLGLATQVGAPIYAGAAPEPAR
jgi:predicted ester cyclase